MENNKNFVLAMVLSLAVLIGWQYFVIGPRMEQERRAAEIEASRQAELSGNTAETSTSPGASAIPQAGPQAGTSAQTSTNTSVPGTPAQTSSSTSHDRKAALGVDPVAEVASVDDISTGAVGFEAEYEALAKKMASCDSPTERHAIATKMLKIYEDNK